jgi:hypothetical protein
MKAAGDAAAVDLFRWSDLVRNLTLTNRRKEKREREGTK